MLIYQRIILLWSFICQDWARRFAKHKKLRPSKHLAAICVLAQGQAPSHPGSNGVDPTCEALEKIEKMRRKIIAELDSVGLLNMLNMLKLLELSILGKNNQMQQEAPNQWLNTPMSPLGLLRQLVLCLGLERKRTVRQKC